MASQTYGRSQINDGTGSGQSGASARRYPFLIGSLIWVAEFIISAAAFSVKVFLRQKLGERTFNVWLVFFSYLWVRYFLIEDMHFEVLNKETVKIFGSEIDDNLYLLYFAIYLILQFFSNLLGLASVVFWVSAEEADSLFVWVYSYIVVILGIAHLLSAFSRNLNHEKWFSYSRGKSVFFGWLEGRKIEGSAVSDTTIWMILDPLLVLFFGAGVYWLLEDENFGLFLMLSAFALFLEERLAFLERKAEVQDVIDGEYRGRRLEAQIMKFNEKETGGRDGAVTDSGAVLADPAKHGQEYQAYISGKGRASSQRQEGARIG